MSSPSSEERTPRPSSLQAMLARLRGMVQALKSNEPAIAAPSELLPNWDDPAHAASNQTAATPTPALDEELADTLEGPPAPPAAEQAPAVGAVSCGACSPASAEVEPSTISD